MPYTRVNDPDKLRRLMAAVLMLTANVELQHLLSHFVDEARALVDASYGALGVLNESGTGLERFLTVGLSDEEERAIGARPTGRGVLGLLITDSRPLRLADLASDAHSFGFPSNHPPMASFLGVPVRVRDEVYGNLYLTNKLGAAEFSGEDEALAEALALAAGIAIQNHRLRERVRVASMLDDRDRIARDLHDRVIQRIFAVGMSLQGAARLPDVTQMASRWTRPSTAPMRRSPRNPHRHIRTRCRTPARQPTGRRCWRWSTNSFPPSGCAPSRLLGPGRHHSFRGHRRPSPRRIA